MNREKQKTMRRFLFGLSKYLAYGVILVIIGIFVPRLSNNYNMTVIVSALIYAIAALGMMLMLGQGGMMSMGTISFMGIGAFFSADMSKLFGIMPALSIPLAVIGTGVVSLLIGTIFVRLRKSYFTFATIGLVQIVNSILLNYKPFSGGPDGLSGIPKLVLFGTQIRSNIQWFYILLGVVVLCTWFVTHIQHTSLGRSLASTRDNEIAAQSLGVNIFKTRLICFVIASMLAGLAGALLAHQAGYISSYLFTYNQSITFLIMVMLGGVSSPLGSVIGAVLVTMLPEWLRFMESYLRLIYGAMVILLMIFMPMGLAGLVGNLRKWCVRAIRNARGKNHAT